MFKTKWTPRFAQGVFLGMLGVTGAFLDSVRFPLQK